MIRSSPHPASGRAARFQPVVRALLVFMGLSGEPLLAQPFRAQAVPPASPSLEARQTFQAKIDGQARLLANDPRLRHVPKHKRRALLELFVGNVHFAATHEFGFALWSQM